MIYITYNRRRSQLDKLQQKTNIQKHSYASIPDIQTSKWVKELTDNNVDAIVQCKYNSLFKKWTPVKEGNSTDTLLDVKE